jgi:hypothetical protein
MPMWAGTIGGVGHRSRGDQRLLRGTHVLRASLAYERLARFEPEIGGTFNAHRAGFNTGAGGASCDPSRLARPDSPL